MIFLVQGQRLELLQIYYSSFNTTVRDEVKLCFVDQYAKGIHGDANFETATTRRLSVEKYECLVLGGSPDRL